MSHELMLRIAIRSFADRGYEATSMRQIAQDVGVRPASLYNHYPAKEDLLWAIVEDAITELGPTLVAEGTYRGRYQPTGKELSAEFCHLWTVRDGRVSAFRQYTDTAAFREITGEA